MSDNFSPNIIDGNKAELQRTILLVDDSETDRLIYQRYLKTESKYQYTFIEAETGEEAFDRYREHQPDIILLDYFLPDIDGLEWLWRLQQQDNFTCSAIVLTGQGDENIAVQFIKMGAVDYFVKGQITAEKLKLSVSREISLQDLRQEKQIFADTVQSQTEELNTVNKLLQCEIDRSEISQQLIRNSEEKFRRALDYAPIPIMIHAEDGEVLQISQTWTELSGYTIEDIPTIDDWLQLAYGKKKDAARLIMDGLHKIDRRVDAGVLSIITGWGETRIWDFNSAPLGRLEDGRRLIISTAKDITDSKKAQAELQLSEDRFRSTFELAAVGIAHVAPDGKWLRVNQKLCQILGYTREELIVKNFQEITHPEDLDTDLEYVRQLLAGQIQTCSLEKRYIRKDRSPIWINLTVSLVKNSDGEPNYFICVIEDISDRHKLESSLQKSFQRLSNLHQIDKAILAAAKPEAIAQTAIENIKNFLTCQRISIINFDWSRETATILAVRGAGDNVQSDGFQTPSAVWQEVIERLQNPARQENHIIAYLHQLPTLNRVKVAMKENELDCFIAFPLKSQNNLLGILQLWVEDVGAITTEELTMVEEISSQIAIAIQQARLYKQTKNYALELEARVAQRTAQIEEINQELKSFTYSISHDLKAPLRAIQGFASALQEDYGDYLDNLGQEYTSRLVFSAQQMTQLIEDLLAYSRLSRAEIKLVAIDLALIVDLAIKQLKLEIDRSGAEITVVKPLSTIMGNKTVLLQIVSNLLSNAIKFVSPHVKPQIRIGIEIVTGSMNDLSASNVRLWIEDNGIGINAKHQERIFKVFERLHGSEAYPGTGIGLAIIKKGMQRLGGRVGVESEQGEGSRFWIEGRQA